jgi:hypothetical protein
MHRFRRDDGYRHKCCHAQALLKLLGFGQLRL